MQQDTHIIGGRGQLFASLNRYIDRYPDERDTVTAMIDFLRREPACFKRSTAEGHFTGSAWIVHPSNNELVLLTHHAKLNKWLQLGGHADGNSNLLEVALMEAREESGIAEFLVLSTEIFDLDIHVIPARGQEPEHLHYDVRFVLRAMSEDYLISHESHDLAWLPSASLHTHTTEHSMTRMANKWNDTKHLF